MLQYDPITSLRHYPGISMAPHGLNPYSEPLFRIVFAPSRQSLVCGEWRDGSMGAKWQPLYGHLGDVWVMEKWLSPFEFCGVSREVWDRDMSVLGAFPDRGEYEHCHTFEACDPVNANIEKLITWIKEGKKRSYQEVRNACAATYDQETKDTQNMQDAAFRDLLPAFGTAPMVGFGGARGSKTDRIRISATEAGLPTKPGMSDNGKFRSA